MPDSLVPKTVSILAEGYGAARLKADALAGLTVAIVALPLSMAIAIGSGVTPDRGLYTAIVGGFLVSLLGGSRVQIGGPAGAFIVLVAATVARHGVDGLLLATFMSGFMLIAAGYLRLGQYIKFIPYPVTVGFTAGIAVIIFASQLRDLFGLTLAGAEPGPIVDKVAALAQAAGTVNWAAVLTAALTVGIILALRRVRPHWPGMLIAVAARPPSSPCCNCRRKRSAAASAAFRADCRYPPCRRSRSKRPLPSFRMPFPSRSSAPSNRFSPPSLPTA